MGLVMPIKVLSMEVYLGKERNNEKSLHLDCFKSRFPKLFNLLYNLVYYRSPYTLCTQFVAYTPESSHACSDVTSLS